MEITLYTATVYYFDALTWCERVVDIESTTRFGLIRIFLEEIAPSMYSNDTARSVYESDIKNSISTEIVKFPRLIYKS